MSSKRQKEEEIDHYSVLGLPSDENSSLLTEKDILKAYRDQSRIRHPDKRPDDPNATADFQRLKSSFEALKDDSLRAALDARLRARRDRAVRYSFLDSKRRKLATDLEERERAAAEEDAKEREVSMSERRAKDAAAEIKRELDAFKARKTANRDPGSAASASQQGKGQENEKVTLDKERMLSVSWERQLGDYSATRLREIFGKFGGVEYVVKGFEDVVKGSKKKASAVIFMSTKDAAVAATHGMSGDLSNPLLVLPVQVASSNVASNSPMYGSEGIGPELNNIIGAGFQSYEASIMKKLEKVAATHGMV